MFEFEFEFEHQRLQVSASHCRLQMTSHHGAWDGYRHCVKQHEPPKISVVPRVERINILSAALLIFLKGIGLAPAYGRGDLRVYFATAARADNKKTQLLLTLLAGFRYFFWRSSFVLLRLF